MEKEISFFLGGNLWTVGWVVVVVVGGADKRLDISRVVVSWVEDCVLCVPACFFFCDSYRASSTSGAAWQPPSSPTLCSAKSSPLVGDSCDLSRGGDGGLRGEDLIPYMPPTRSLSLHHRHWKGET